MVSKVALFLDELLDTVEAKAPDIKFDNTARSRVAMALFSTIFAQTRAAVTILKAAHFGGLEVLVRSNLEAYVHLKNTLDDPAYIYRMEANYLASQVCLFAEAQNGNNDYLLGLAANAEAKEVFDMQNDRLKTLRQEGHHPINTYQRFERAGLADLYRTAYSHLSAYAHQELGALTRRYTTEVDGVGRIRLHPAMDRDELELSIDSMAGMLSGSNVWIHRTFKTPHVALFEGMDAKLGKLREERDGC
jgi:hypothetical protein